MKSYLLLLAVTFFSLFLITSVFPFGKTWIRAFLGIERPQWKLLTSSYYEQDFFSDSDHQMLCSNTGSSQIYWDHLLLRCKEKQKHLFGYITVPKMLLSLTGTNR